MQRYSVFIEDDATYCLHFNFSFNQFDFLGRCTHASICSFYERWRNIISVLCIDLYIFSFNCVLTQTANDFKRAQASKIIKIINKIITHSSPWSLSAWQLVMEKSRKWRLKRANTVDVPPRTIKMTLKGKSRGGKERASERGKFLCLIKLCFKYMDLLRTV